MATGLTGLLNLITEKILTGGRRTKAVNTREVLNEISNSNLNRIDGGMVLQALVGYTIELTPTDNKHLVPKKYVDTILNTKVNLLTGSVLFDFPGSNKLIISTDNGGLLKAWIDLEPTSAQIGFNDRWFTAAGVGNPFGEGLRAIVEGGVYTFQDGVTGNVATEDYVNEVGDVAKSYADSITPIEVTDSTTISKLTNNSNWTNNNYTGPTITGPKAGDYYCDGTYYYKFCTSYTIRIPYTLL